jgi:hypothetical protein
VFVLFEAGAKGSAARATAGNENRQGGARNNAGVKGVFAGRSRVNLVARYRAHPPALHSAVTEGSLNVLTAEREGESGEYNEPWTR